MMSRPPIRHDREQLIFMISGLGVKELKLLLQLAGVHSCNYVEERSILVEKALQLIDLDDRYAIGTKIEELFLNSGANPAVVNSAYYDGSDYLYNSRSMVQHLPTCDFTGSEHSSLATSAPHTIGSALRQVPFTECAFYKRISNVYNLPTLISELGIGSAGEFSFPFTLNPMQSLAIRAGAEIKSQQVVHNVGLHLRFRPVKTGSDTIPRDEYPSSLQVIINDKLFDTKNETFAEPIDITDAIFSDTTRIHVGQIYWMKEQEKEYALTIDMFKKISPDQLISDIKCFNWQTKNLTEQLVLRHFAGDDDDIAATKLKVCVQCPITMSRLTLPTKGVNCDHIRCFELSTYINMNYRRPKWICPICNKPCPHNALLLDSYLYDILTSPKFRNEYTSIRLFRNGSWTHFPDSDSDYDTDNGSSVTISGRRKKIKLKCSLTSNSVDDLSIDSFHSNSARVQKVQSSEILSSVYLTNDLNRNQPDIYDISDSSDEHTSDDYN